MSRNPMVTFRLCIAFTRSVLAHGQLTSSTATVGSFGSDQNLCFHQQSLDGRVARPLSRLMRQGGDVLRLIHAQCTVSLC